MATVFLVDTGYLCEFYRLPECHRSGFRDKIRQRMRQCSSARFYVPLGCLYQLCDHIGDVSNGHQRRELAKAVESDINTSIDEAIPWVIVPATNVEDELRRLLRAFSEDPGLLKMGLTDSTVVSEANRLKRKYSASLDYRVHIWTTDKTLKGYEPDEEPDPLL